VGKALEDKLRLLLVATMTIVALSTIIGGGAIGSFKLVSEVLYRKLNEPVELTCAGWSVEDLVSYIEDEHNIVVSLPAEFRALTVKERKLEARLKNVIHIALRSCGNRKLTYTVADGRMFIIPVDDVDDICVYRTSVYGIEDLRAPRAPELPGTSASESCFEFLHWNPFHKEPPALEGGVF